MRRPGGELRATNTSGPRCVARHPRTAAARVGAGHPVHHQPDAAPATALRTRMWATPRRTPPDSSPIKTIARRALRSVLTALAEPRRSNADRRRWTARQGCATTHRGSLAGTAAAPQAGTENAGSMPTSLAIDCVFASIRAIACDYARNAYPTIGERHGSCAGTDFMTGGGSSRLLMPQWIGYVGRGRWRAGARWARRPGSRGIDAPPLSTHLRSGRRLPNRVVLT